ncbi:MAG: succinate dehydrogenase, hydrophobic membrane anchor protein [Gammaproteobacteria bacterium]|nr:succinate dehydrogenase, hydrophobic membrane anchor protein [Gammaproteobacteria bacterium]
MRFRTPLSRVRGLGSAKGGTHHWWAQRITALALVPLSVWLAASLVTMTGATHGDVVAWMRSPPVAIAWVVLIIALFHHAQLGVQVVVEDYVHTPWLKISTLVLIKLAAVVLAVACVLAVLRIWLGG